MISISTTAYTYSFRFATYGFVISGKQEHYSYLEAKAFKFWIWVWESTNSSICLIFKTPSASVSTVAMITDS